MPKTRKYLLSQHHMMNASIKWATATKSVPRLKQQKQNLKQQWIRNLMNSKLKSNLITQQHSTSYTWNYHLSIQKNILLLVANLLLILSSGQSSGHLKNPHIHHNLPNTYLTWPYKATHFFRFKNGGIPLFLTSPNPFQQKRSGRHTNISNLKITIKYSFILTPDTHHILATAKEKYEAFYRELRVHIVKDGNIPSSKAPKSHFNLITHMSIYNGVDIITTVFSSMSPQLGVLGPKSQEFVISFRLGEG